MARFGAGAHLDVTRATLLGGKTSYVTNYTSADTLSTLGSDGTGGLQLLSSTASVGQVYLTNTIVYGNDAGRNRVDIDFGTARIDSANTIQGTQRGPQDRRSGATRYVTDRWRGSGASGRMPSKERRVEPARRSGDDDAYVARCRRYRRCERAAAASPRTVLTLPPRPFAPSRCRAILTMPTSRNPST